MPLESLALKYRARSRDLVESLFASPFVQIATLARQFGITYPTAKADLMALVDAGILTELPDHRPKAFFCAEILKIAYREENPLVAPEPPTSL